MKNENWKKSYQQNRTEQEGRFERNILAGSFAIALLIGGCYIGRLQYKLNAQIHNYSNTNHINLEMKAR